MTQLPYQDSTISDTKGHPIWESHFWWPLCFAPVKRVFVVSYPTDDDNDLYHTYWDLCFDHLYFNIQTTKKIEQLLTTLNISFIL